MMRLAFMLLAAFTLPSFADHEMTDRDLASGAKLYQDQCATCHGANLEGQPNWQIRKEGGTMPAPPHDKTGHTWHHNNRLLFDYTKLGGAALLSKRGVENFKSGMPGFDGVLTDDEIWDILSYIKSTWPEELQATQQSLNKAHN